MQTGLVPPPGQQSCTNSKDDNGNDSIFKIVCHAREPWLENKFGTNLRKLHQILGKSSETAQDFVCTPNSFSYLLTFFRRSNILVLLHRKIHDILLCTSAVLGAVLERPKSVCMGIAKVGQLPGLALPGGLAHQPDLRPIQDLQKAPLRLHEIAILMFPTCRTKTLRHTLPPKKQPSKT